MKTAHGTVSHVDEDSKFRDRTDIFSIQQGAAATQGTLSEVSSISVDCTLSKNPERKITSDVG